MSIVFEELRAADHREAIRRRAIKGDTARAVDTIAEAALRALGEIVPEYGYGAFIKPVADKMDVDREVARMALRILRSQGLAEYVNGLFNEDGMTAGSGYTLTERGFIAYRALPDLRRDWSEE